MRFKRSARLATIAVVATGLLGLVGIQTAGAAGVITLSQSSGLSDGQLVTITLTGVVPGPINTLQLSECGNAYGDGTPIFTVARNAANCEVLAFVQGGGLNSDPLVFTDVAIRQTGIGTGNRSCVSSPPGLQHCFLYVSTAVNQPTFPSVDVTFASPLEGAAPAETTTTITPIGSPIGTDKVGHADVRVVANADSTMRPEGSVEVLEGSTVLGTSTVVDGSANVAFGTLPLGAHDLVARFTGNNSFAASVSGTGTMDVISANNISIGDATVVEGDFGTRLAQFPVILPAPPAVGVTVNWAVTPSGANQAAVGTDIVNLKANLSGKFTFTALKQSVRYVRVKIASDTVQEADETFSVTVTVASPTGPSGYVLRRGEGTATIFDDDATAGNPATVGIGSSLVPEGDVGPARALSLSLSLSKPVTTAITAVSISISSLTAVHNPKTKGGDWSGAVNRIVKFPAGVYAKQVAISVFPDLTSEYDESVSVAITGVTLIGLGEVPAISSHNVGTGIILTEE